MAPPLAGLCILLSSPPWLVWLILRWKNVNWYSFYKSNWSEIPRDSVMQSSLPYSLPPLESALQQWVLFV